MLEPVITSTTDPRDIHPELATYQNKIMDHCPFLAPSLSRSHTTWSSYAVDGDESASLLGLLVERAETLRHARRLHGPLVCHNLALTGPDNIAAAQKLMDWPAWIIRNLYAPVQIMIGRFWIGERRTGKHGRAIPPPPTSFFSLRHSFTDQDARFLATFPLVAQRLAASGDHGQDILEPWLGMPLSSGIVAERYYELVKLFPPERKATP